MPVPKNWIWHPGMGAIDPQTGKLWRFLGSTGDNPDSWACAHEDGVAIDSDNNPGASLRRAKAAGPDFTDAATIALTLLVVLDNYTAMPNEVSLAYPVGGFTGEQVLEMYNAQQDAH